MISSELRVLADYHEQQAEAALGISTLMVCNTAGHQVAVNSVTRHVRWAAQLRALATTIEQRGL